MRETNIQQNRYIKLDIARTFAILCVCLCHCSELIYVYSPKTVIISELSVYSRVFMIVSFTLGRLGVPVFLFLTGALLLRKTMDSDESVFDFYKAKLLPLVLINATWIIIYNIFSACFLNEVFDFWKMIKEIFLLKNPAMMNMWYMPVIIGMYIGIPFVAKIIKSFSFKTISVVIAATFIISYVVPAVNSIMKIYGIQEEWNPVISVPFLGGAYGLYILLGYYIHNGSVKKLKTYMITVIMIISFVITVAVQYISYERWSCYNYRVWYDFPFVLITAVCIYMLFERIDDEKINNIFSHVFTYISRISFGIFLVHVLVISILKEYIGMLGLSMPLTVIIFTITAFLLSVVIIFILSRNKYIAKYCLLIK